MIRTDSQCGFSMIEMLIALLVLAVGVYGQMALQMNSISSNQSSYYRSQAAVIANEFAERMRLNSAEAGVNGTSYDSISIDSTSTYSKPTCYSTGCDADDQVDADIYDLQENLQNSIPSGSATVTRDAGVSAQAVYNITISWDIEDRKGLGNGSEVNQFSLDVGI
ncbi:type IV pilus modification protein PilV [Aurantivibrio plasticivorans]